MHEVQVEVVRLQRLEAGGEALGDVLVPGVVQLGRQPNVRASHAGRSDAVADLLLVAVGEGRVDVAVARAQGCLDGALDLVGLGLPGAQADGGDLVA